MVRSAKKAQGLKSCLCVEIHHASCRKYIAIQFCRKHSKNATLCRKHFNNLNSYSKYFIQRYEECSFAFFHLGSWHSGSFTGCYSHTSVIILYHSAVKSKQLLLASPLLSEHRAGGREDGRTDQMCKVIKYAEHGDMLEVLLKSGVRDQNSWNSWEPSGIFPCPDLPGNGNFRPPPAVHCWPERDGAVQHRSLQHKSSYRLSTVTFVKFSSKKKAKLCKVLPIGKLLFHWSGSNTSNLSQRLVVGFAKAMDSIYYRGIVSNTTYFDM